tara:strand:- start:47 stop:418 length:372 start_codon:yes stop_codon:yes gene_type:complete
MKKLTEKRLIKILGDCLPRGYDKKSLEVKLCPHSNNRTLMDAPKIMEVSVLDAIMGRQIWFYYWLNEKKQFHLSMDGATSWDYLSSDSVYKFDDLETKFIKSFEEFGLYPHPNNNYSFTVGEN